MYRKVEGDNSALDSLVLLLRTDMVRNQPPFWKICLIFKPAKTQTQMHILQHRSHHYTTPWWMFAFVYLLLIRADNSRFKPPVLIHFTIWTQHGKQDWFYSISDVNIIKGLRKGALMAPVMALLLDRQHIGKELGTSCMQSLISGPTRDVSLECSYFPKKEDSGGKACESCLTTQAMRWGISGDHSKCGGNARDRERLLCSFCRKIRWNFIM